MHNWVLFLFWLLPFILSGVISPLISIVSIYYTVFCKLKGFLKIVCLKVYLPRWFSGKESICKAEDTGSLPWWRRSPVEGHLLQCSHLGNAIDRGAWWAIFHGVTNSRAQLSG